MGGTLDLKSNLGGGGEASGRGVEAASEERGAKRLETTTGGGGEAGPAGLGDLGRTKEGSSARGTT